MDNKDKKITALCVWINQFLCYFTALLMKYKEGNILVFSDNYILNSLKNL